MSTYTGLDIAPSALRWFVRENENAHGRIDGPIYGIRGCPRHSDGGYDSSVTWSDAMAFRQGEFVETFDDGVEKTVRYELPAGHSSEWLKSFFKSANGHPTVDVNGSIAVAVPDHASPEDRDDVLAGLSATKYANISLIWRPVAAMLAWMEQLKQKGEDVSRLIGRRIFVLDFDGGRPELTELAAVRHRKFADWIVPSRHQPIPSMIADDDGFEKTCYQEALSGVCEWKQLLGGQFFGDVQKSIESGAKTFDAWIRKGGSWISRRIDIATKLSPDILKMLNPVLGPAWKGMAADDLLLVNGWVVRRYGEQILAPFRARCGYVQALDASAVAEGAALFAERLAKGQPTFYDRIPDYRFWDGFKMSWESMFDGDVEVEPGLEYHYPEVGQPMRKLRIEKFSDNVSFYVQEPSSREYARRIKTDFVEFLREDIELRLSSVVSPEKGSARFTLSMCDELANAVFVSGKTATREINLRWTAALNVNKSVSVKLIDEHQGYVEPQPVLGRIYDSEDNLRMVEEFVKNPHGEEFKRLWGFYSAHYHPDGRSGIADRVGYKAQPVEPTRGLFGTKYVFNSRVDSASHAFAMKCAKDEPYATTSLLPGFGSLLKDGMLQQNYCHSAALDDYKDLIRTCLKDGAEPQFNFSFYNASGYVLGEKDGDLDLLLGYICAKTNLQAERGKLWWSFFRMLCWHPECKLKKESKTLLESALTILCEQDAQKIVSGGRWAINDVKYLPLAILYSLRIRETGEDLSDGLKNKLIDLLSSGLLSNIAFPKTMIPKVDPASRSSGDTLSKYVLRFLKREDTLADRELGAAMGGV